jgi:two-component system heavy metal sensor histidine kinase CusS
MSSKPIESLLAIEGRVTRGWSIAVRLVSFFTVAAAVLLLVMMAAAYWVVVRHVDHDNDRYLTDKIAAIQADMAVDTGSGALNRQLGIIKAADKTYAVRVIDPSGKVVAQSPKMDRILPISAFPRNLSERGQRPSTVLYYASRNRVFALTTATAQVGNQRYLIQLAQDRTHDESFARRYAALFAAMVCCAVATCAGIAILLTRRSLRPLKELADSIERTGVSHLHERLPVGDWPEELQPLAVAFNKMLGRLEDSFTRLSHFSADLAHELRTPIAILRGEAEGILTRPRSSDEYREVIESGLEELQRLSAMIDNLLFLARAETTGSFKLTRFDGRMALENIREFYEAVAQEKGVGIECHGEGDIYAEPMLFRRALINLLTNALRFTPTGGNISVSLSRHNGTAEVTVADTGSGIATQHVPHVFDRFFRGDATRHSEGTGLGLSIVKSIMEIHKGEVKVESEVGRGTVITLRFPEGDGSQPQAERVTARTPQPA